MPAKTHCESEYRSIDIKADIVIVGGGIAGPALAAALADTGLTIVLVERNADSIDTARGDHLQPRSVELLANWGVLDRMLAAGAEQRLGTRWYGTDGRLLIDISVANLEIPHPYFLFLNHEQISAQLLTAAAHNTAFKLLRPSQSWSMSDDARPHQQLTVTMRDGAQYRIRTRLLVGADGRSSGVRAAAGIEATVQRYDRPINVLFGDRVSPPADNALEVHLCAAGIVGVIPRMASGVKIGVASMPAETRDWREAGPAALRERMRQLIGDLRVAKLRYGGVYPAQRTQTQQLARDRTVLLGDACHSLHPAQSQGMNLALRCVDELAHALKREPDNFPLAIQQFETSSLPEIQQVCDANHQAGVLFDNAEPAALARWADYLRDTAEDTDATRRYALRAAGYPDPIS